jgi:hypothetical protein
MKRTQLLVLSVLALGLQGVAQADTFPSDAEASYSLPAASSWADKHAGSLSAAQSVFPSDAEASYTVQARESYAERHAADAERAMRPQPVIAFRGDNLDD